MISQKAQENRDSLVKDLIDAMKNGTAPWQQPWTGDMETPFNAVSGRHYHGVNFVRLSLRGAQLGQGGDPRWCTYEQAKEKGWHVKPGEKGTKVEFYKFDEKPKFDDFGDPVLDDEGNQKVDKSVVVRNYVVFHASQIDGIEPYVPKVHNAVECSEKAERILKESGADIRHGGDSAFYAFEKDFIQLPAMEQFNSQADYYATALHELTHWTGHPSRLNREQTSDMKSEAYAREELVAEIGSMFVSAETGIPQTKEHLDNHASYVDFWIKAVEEDPNALFKAVSQAQKASEEILKHERIREQSQNREQQQYIQQTGDAYESTSDLGRVAYLVMRANEFEKSGQQANSDLFNSLAIRQGVYATGLAQPDNSGFYNIFKLRDIMTDAGMKTEDFESFLKKLRDTEQIQLHSGDVTVHTDEENAKGFVDENGFRMGTFTLNDRQLEKFEVTKYILRTALEHLNNSEQQQKPSIDKPDDQRIAARSVPDGEPVPVSTLTEKTIRDLKLIEGETKIFMKPRVDGQTYKGKVLHVDEGQGYCVQQVGKQSLVVHQLGRIEESPKVGEAVKIAYDAKGEKAKISVQEEKQHRGLHR